MPPVAGYVLLMATGMMAGAERAAHTWREPLGRAGLVAKGALYIVLGVLAIQFASGDTSSDEVSQTGAIERVAEQPFGKFLLVALTVGLAALTIWHVIQALTGDPVEGDDASDRAKFAAKAVVHGALTVAAIVITARNWSGSGASSAGSGDEAPREAASTLFDLPGGAVLVGLVGVVLLAVAAYQLVTGVARCEFMQRIAPPSGSAATLEAMGRTGYAARATVVALSGIFFIVAAVQHDPSESKGMSGALQELADLGWGRIVLWVVAVGLVLFGLFSLAEARYRRAA